MDESTNRSSRPAIGRSTGFVRVQGAREHDLKDVSLDIPRDALVVLTGISRSGKSSLAFGEGWRAGPSAIEPVIWLSDSG